MKRSRDGHEKHSRKDVYADVLCRLRSADQQRMLGMVRRDWTRTISHLRDVVAREALRDPHAASFKGDDATLRGLPTCTECAKHIGANGLLIPDLAKKQD